MGKFQILLLVSIVTCAIISSVESVPVKDSSVENDNSQKCKNLCGFCGCTGYYCGAECLCECNSQTDGESECVNTMKSNCKKLELPFEVLIQGPNINRMVRSLLYAEPNEEVCAKPSESQEAKRSTIRIYKPDVLEQQDEILSVPGSYKVDVSSVVAKEDDPVAAELEYIIDDVFNADAKPSSSEDVIERTNNKRHIIDVNQDIANVESMRETENNSLHKRQTDGDGTEVGDDGTSDGDDGAIVGDDGTDGGDDPDVGLVAPLEPEKVTVAKVISGAIAKIKIPTDIEVKAVWEEYRKKVDTAIAGAVADVKKQAEALTALAPPILKIDSVGPALIPNLVIDPLKKEFITGLAIGAIKKDVEKNIEAFKLKNLAIQEAVKLGVAKNLLVPAAVLGAAQDVTVDDTVENTVDATVDTTDDIEV